jgi:hypothetical protein
MPGIDAVKGSLQFSPQGVNGRDIGVEAIIGYRISVEWYRLFGKCSGSKVRCMQRVTPAGALVGRDSEMALLTGLINEVARGRGGSVLIEGEPGIGKSALVQAAVAQAPEAGCQVFWGTVTSWARSCRCYRF